MPKPPQISSDQPCGGQFSLHKTDFDSEWQKTVKESLFLFRESFGSRSHLSHLAEKRPNTFTPYPLGQKKNEKEEDGGEGFVGKWIFFSFSALRFFA